MRKMYEGENVMSYHLNQITLLMCHRPVTGESENLGLTDMRRGKMTYYLRRLLCVARDTFQH